MCLLDKNKNPLLYIETKEQGRIIDNNFMLMSKITSDNSSHRP